MNEPSIRAAIPDDATAIAQLSAQLGYPCDSQELLIRLRQLLTSDQDVVLVALLDGAVVGWIHAHRSVSLESGERGEIAGLVVAEAARRCGAGRLLVDSVETWMREQSLPRLVVRSNVARVESHRFYPALGFQLNKTQYTYSKSLL